MEARYLVDTRELGDLEFEAPVGAFGPGLFE
jgi:hypothetical protein